MNKNTLLNKVGLLIVGIGLAGNSSNGALQFNGSNSYGTMNQSFLNGATVTNFTIEFWAKNKRPEIYQNLCGKVEYWKEWGIGFPSGGAIGFGQAWPNTYYDLTTPNGVMKSNQWQHVAVVGQGTLGSIYVDGVLVCQENSLRGQISFNAAVSGTTIAGFVLGFRDNATLPDDGWFRGDLADYRIWDIALSPSQVASLHSTQPATNAVGLRHWIPFNEGTGSTFTDIIGGLQGQLFNTAWSSDSPIFNSILNLTNGLVAYYPFNGNANDESGNGKNGVLLGGSYLTTDRSGRPNSAYYFNGGTDSIQVNGVGGNRQADQKNTVSIWMNWTGVFSNPDDPGAYVFEWGTPGQAYGLYIQNHSGHPRLGFGSGGGDVWGITYGADMPNHWIHVVAVFNNGNTRVGQIFINGTEATLDMTLGGLPSNTTVQRTVGPDAIISGWIEVANRYRFIGSLDDVRIYNRALSSQEVQQLYAIESQPCIPHAAKATAQIVNGFVVGATITDGGCGYTNAPLVLITGGGGSGAEGFATINNGVVTGINITSTGIGYTNAPRAQIASPPFMPWLGMDVKTVKVTMHVVLGKNYVLESSLDLKTWGQIGSQFTAQEEEITQEFDVDVVGKYFRIQQVP